MSVRMKKDCQLTIIYPPGNVLLLEGGDHVRLVRKPVVITNGSMQEFISKAKDDGHT